MSEGWATLVAWLPTAASLVGVVWLFANPRELGVNEARALAAKQPARLAFWSVAAVLLIDSGRFIRFAVGGSPAWPRLVLPAAVVAGLAVYRLQFARTHPGILETISDELVRQWKCRFPTRRTLVVLVIALGGWAAIRFFVF